MSSISETSLKLEIGLHVVDLDASARFYRILFDCAPVLQTTDRVRFDVEDPRLRLSLTVGPVAACEAVNHFGFRIEDSWRLIDIQQRLELAGISTDREDDVECCYSRQTKFWVTDPQGNMWEIYSLAEEESADDHRFIEPQAETVPAVWGNARDQVFTLPLELATASIDEVHLDNPFSGRDSAWIADCWRELRRILKPGGSVAIHREIATLDQVAGELLQLDRAGFSGSHIERLERIETESEIRWDLWLSAIRADEADSEGHVVMYLGPASSVRVTDTGWLQRNRRTRVAGSTVSWLNLPTLGTQVCGFQE